MDKRNILENLINHFAGGNKALFARQIGESPQTISAWIRRGSFNVESIYKVYTDVNPHWLLTGEGEMMKDGNANNVTTGDYSPVNLNGHMDVRQTVHKEERELELLRTIIAEKERIIETQQQLIDALRSK